MILPASAEFFIEKEVKYGLASALSTGSTQEAFQLD